ncbi:hypothetical protein L1857_06520 [Amycolatopsis thermalba]|uniref:Secreted protein n=1 Tax=Amycolatopsis thermalba TaxID=944492 RepID=A0ABY4NP81_9PSEU|nr:hypothetical protein L1857_06520 [Amycolatopsis thermalba]
MRNRTVHVLRAGLVLAVLATATTTGVASAAPASQAEPAGVSFGLLGPVGLAAVLLGIIGMALGIVRQRRKAQAEAVVPVIVETCEEPTRPALTPYRRPQV